MDKQEYSDFLTAAITEKLAIVVKDRMDKKNLSIDEKIVILNRIGLTASCESGDEMLRNITNGKFNP